MLRKSTRREKQKLVEYRRKYKIRKKRVTILIRNYFYLQNLFFPDVRLNEMHRQE